jgi:Amt family ammonium transporter
VCFFATQFIKRKLIIDDSLDVFPVHGVGGFLGILLTAPLSLYLGGLGLADGQTVGGQLVVQLTGAVATVVWCGVATFVLLKLIGVVVPLRAEEDDERQGLDLTQHDERGYNL